MDQPGYARRGFQPADERLRPKHTAPPIRATPGFTSSNESDIQGIGLEFKDSETIDNAGGPWWQQLVGLTNGPALDFEAYNMFAQYGLPGVVTGVVTIDGIHGAYAESHPVFALALDTQDTVVKTGANTWTLQQDWVYFVRNYGNGGGCSEAYYLWPGQSGGEYYIQLPWPKKASGVNPGAGGQFWDWQAEKTQFSGMLSPNEVPAKSE